MKTEQTELARLKLNEANPRQIRDSRFTALVNSLLIFPKMLELRPIVCDDDMTILAGNMRYRALLDIAQMGEQEALSRLERVNGWDKRTESEKEALKSFWGRWFDKPTACMAKASGLSDEEKREFIIKDNASFGEWDWDALANGWDAADLNAWGLDFPQEWAEEKHRNLDISEDDFDEGEDVVEERVKTGDVWKLGEHLLACADSTEKESYERLIGGEKADMVFTDPPYGVSIGSKNELLNKIQKKSGRCTKNIENDTLSPERLYPLLVKAMTNVRENCKEDACYYVTSPQGGELGLMMMMMMMKDAGLPVRHMLIWKKDSPTFSLGRLDYDYQHEPIFYTWTKKHHNYRGGAYRTTIWEFPKPRKCDLHPTMKPVELVANCLIDATKEGDIVLDVFGGSGTTMIACEQLGRKCRMMEIDPHYCDVIIARWEKLTGEKSVKIR